MALVEVGIDVVVKRNTGMRQQQQHQPDPGQWPPPYVRQQGPNKRVNPSSLFGIGPIFKLR